MLNKKRILVIGCFGDKTGRLDGQIVKSQAILEMIQERIGHNANLHFFNTLSIRDDLWEVFRLLAKLLWCNIVVLIPADHNLEVFFPLLYRFSIIKPIKIIQICVGGWQVDFFIGRGKWHAHPLQMKMSKKCIAFLPEINKVKEELQTICKFTNCEVFPNFRRNIPNIVHRNNSTELRLVWLARINREKGFETVFNLANYVKENKMKVSITFYGKIEEKDYIVFTDLLKKYHNIVKYGGQLPPEKIARTLCDYDVMLFPTKYYTEGFPGTVLDAYISGLPVVATAWMHASEFIEDGITGFIVPFENSQDFFNSKINELYNDRDLLNKMKIESRKKADNYTEDVAWSVLAKYLEIQC